MSRSQTEATHSILLANFTAAAYDTTVGSTAGDLSFASGVATAPSAGTYRIAPVTNGCRFRVNSDVVASGTPVAEGGEVFVELGSGDRISAIREGGTDATVNVVLIQG